MIMALDALMSEGISTYSDVALGGRLWILKKYQHCVKAIHRFRRLHGLPQLNTLRCPYREFHGVNSTHLKDDGKSVGFNSPQRLDLSSSTSLAAIEKITLSY